MAKKKSNSKKSPVKKSAAKNDLPTFEDALEQLKQCLEALESDELTLDESLAQYESGVGHLKHCHRAIAAAKQKIEKLVKIDANGNAIVESFDNTASQDIASGTRRSTSDQNDQFDDEQDMDDSDGLF